MSEVMDDIELDDDELLDRCRYVSTSSWQNTSPIPVVTESRKPLMPDLSMSTEILLKVIIRYVRAMSSP